MDYGKFVVSDRIGASGRRGPERVLWVLGRADKPWRWLAPWMGRVGRQKPYSGAWRGLGGMMDEKSSVIIQQQQEIQRLKQHEAAFSAALRHIDTVQHILPGFIRLGEDKFAAMVRLAHAYRELRKGRH